MMRSKNYVLFVFFMVLQIATYAQSNFNLLNATTADEIGKEPLERQLANKDTPLSYGYVDDRDILWSKVVWEQIDLNERINLPLYYPIDSAYVESSRKSMYTTLLKGIKDGKITEIYEDSFFKSRLTMKEINMKLTRVDTSDYAFELINQGRRDISEFVDEISIKTEDIDSYQIKGIWYFDKRQGEMRYRLLAIAPMAPDVQILGREDIKSDEKLPLFWIFYPNAREVLHNGTAFNEKNHRSPISFDQIFNARRFSSVILREENLFGNRSISEYIRGNSLYQIMESERIRELIRNKELDMWNY